MNIDQAIKKASVDLKKYQIISCPGCYPTSILLPLIPLFKKNLIKFNSIIIDSKSGYSGAGKGFEKKFRHKNLFNSTYNYLKENKSFNDIFENTFLDKLQFKILLF